MSETLSRTLQLFCTFFKIGAFTFGGGYAMIPLISKETVEHKGWITDDDILEIIAIAESTPGPIAINSATFVGYRVAGFFGAFAATLGVILPSFVTILAISFILDQFRDNPYVNAAFFGVRAGVLALVFKALISMYKKAPKGLFSYLVMALSFVCVAFFKINVLYVILGCALAGILAALFARKQVNK